MNKKKKINHASDYRKEQNFGNEDQICSEQFVAEKWLYTRKDASLIFQVSLVTLWNWKKRNILTPITPEIGGKVYYTRNAILELINPNTNLKTNKHEND